MLDVIGYIENKQTVQHMSDIWCTVCFIFKVSPDVGHMGCFIFSVSPGVEHMLYSLFYRQCVTWCRTQGVQFALSSVCHLVLDTWCTVCRSSVCHLVSDTRCIVCFIFSVSPGVGHKVYSLFYRQCVT